MLKKLDTSDAPDHGEYKLLQDGSEGIILLACYECGRTVVIKIAPVEKRVLQPGNMWAKHQTPGAVCQMHITISDDNDDPTLAAFRDYLG